MWFNPYWINSILGVEWYVGDLCIFYLLCPLLNKVIKGIKSCLICLLISLCVSTTAIVLYNLLASIEVKNETDMFWNTFFFFHQLPVLLLGILIYYVIEGIEKGKCDFLRVMTCFILGAVLVFGVFVSLNLNKRFMTSSFVAGFIFACILLISYYKREFFTRPMFKPFVFLGIHSYGVYLFHYTVIRCLVLISHDNDNLLLWGGYYLIVVFVSVIITIVEESIEKKLLLR